jgi:hypothetical protein
MKFCRTGGWKEEVRSVISSLVASVPLVWVSLHLGIVTCSTRGDSCHDVLSLLTIVLGHEASKMMVSPSILYSLSSTECWVHLIEEPTAQGVRHALDGRSRLVVHI